MAYVGIPAFIVTLAGMLIFRGANQFVGKSNTVPVPTDFQFIGAGYLPEVGPNTGYNNLTLLLGLLVVRRHHLGRDPRPPQRQVTSAPTVADAWVIVHQAGPHLRRHPRTPRYLFATGRPGTSFPIPGLILAVLVLLYGFISTKTIIGRHIYAVGGNRHAAELSGVKSKRVNFLVMMNMSVLAALAGMIFVGRSTASGPFDGVGWELDAIAAVFIGGAAVTGGVGTVDRLDHRRPGHGRAEQRPAAAGRRRRPDPDHQGPGAAGRRRLRRLQQDARASRRIIGMMMKNFGRSSELKRRRDHRRPRKSSPRPSDASES